MHTVHEIWRTQGQDSQPVVMHYVTNTGERYTDRFDVDIEEPRILLLQVVDGDVIFLHQP